MYIIIITLDIYLLIYLYRFKSNNAHLSLLQNLKYNFICFNYIIQSFNIHFHLSNIYIFNQVNLQFVF